MGYRNLSLLCLLLLASYGLLRTVQACPFCTAQSQTLTEEMESMDAVVLAKLVEPAPAESNDPTEPVPKGKFEVIECLKGETWVHAKQKIEVLYYSDAPVGSTFLVMAVVEGEQDKQQALIWSTPMKASERSREYISKLSSLPKSGAERLAFFQKHLEDAEELLARDAYDEFAKSPYEEVIALKPQMNHDQLIAWIKNEDIPASRRRLYLTMLGVCGSEKDLPLLEEMIRSEDRSRRAGLDALLACYLTLKGETGLPLIEELYFKNKKAEYSDVNSAIMALRFHGTDANVIPAKKIVPVIRELLNRPELADLIIPDLARWEDWESLDKLVDLFKTADTKSTWVREPIINFVRVCPLPEAKERFKELEQLDPAAVKRASRYLPFGPPKPPADTKQTSQIPQPTKSNLVAVKESTAQVTTQKPSFAAVNTGAKTAAAASKKNVAPANLSLLWSVTGSVGLLLMIVQWSLLKGSGKI